MVGPHLSGLELLGHRVTVGNVTLEIDSTTVTDFMGWVYHAGKMKIVLFFFVSVKIGQW